LIFLLFYYFPASHVYRRKHSLVEVGLSPENPLFDRVEQFPIEKWGIFQLVMLVFMAVYQSFVVLTLPSNTWGLQAKLQRGS